MLVVNFPYINFAPRASENLLIDLLVIVSSYTIINSVTYQVVEVIDVVDVHYAQTLVKCLLTLYVALYP